MPSLVPESVARANVPRDLYDEAVQNGYKGEFEAWRENRVLSMQGAADAISNAMKGLPSKATRKPPGESLRWLFFVRARSQWHSRGRFTAPASLFVAIEGHVGDGMRISRRSQLSAIEAPAVARQHRRRSRTHAARPAELQRQHCSWGGFSTCAIRAQLGSGGLGALSARTDSRGWR